MRTKAVVLEVDGDRAVLLREGGQFLRVPLRGRRWQVGQEVLLEEAPRRPWWRLPAAWAAAAALLLAVLAAGLVTPVSAETSYVTVDTGAGSVGLVTGEGGEVVQVLALTAGAGELVEEEMRLVGQPVDRAILQLVDRAATRAPVAAEPGVVLIGAAPLRAGQGLPPAVREAVHRARQQADGLLQERGSPARPAVIQVDDPEVGPSLGRVARQRRLSVAYSVLWAARQVAAARAPAPEDLTRVLGRLAEVPGEELWRPGKPDAPVDGVLKALLDGGGVLDLAGLPRDDVPGRDGEPARDGAGEKSSGPGAGREAGSGRARAPRGDRGEERGGRAGEHGPGANTGGAGRDRRGGRDNRGDGGDGRGGTAISTLPQRAVGGGLAGRHAGGDHDGGRDRGHQHKKEQVGGRGAGGGDRKDGARTGHPGSRGGLIDCRDDRDEADDSRRRGNGARDEDDDRSDLGGLLRGVLESILCRDD